MTELRDSLHPAVNPVESPPVQPARGGNGVNMTINLNIRLQERVAIAPVARQPDACDERLEELAYWLYHLMGPRADAVDHVRRLSRDLGLISLQPVADALHGLPANAVTATRAALAARCIRLGEASILALWDRQDRGV